MNLFIGFCFLFAGMAFTHTPASLKPLGCFRANICCAGSTPLIGNRIPFRIPPKSVQSNRTTSEYIPPVRFWIELFEIGTECIDINPLEQAPPHSVRMTFG